MKKSPKATKVVFNKKNRVGTILVVISLILIGVILSQRNLVEKKDDVQKIETKSATNNSISFGWHLLEDIGDPTWKTYENLGMGIKISMPQGYIVDSSSGYLAFHPEYKNIQGEGISAKDIKIEIYGERANEEEKIDSNLYYEQHKSEGMRWGQEAVYLDGTKAIHDYWKGHGDGETYFFVYKGYKTMLMKYPQVSDYDEDFKKIISSITFE